MISKCIFCLSHCQASVTMEIPHPLTDTHMHKDTHTHTTPVQSDLYRDLKKRENHGRVLFFVRRKLLRRSERLLQWFIFSLMESELKKKTQKTQKRFQNDGDDGSL